MKDKYETIDCEFISETDKAILVVTELSKKEVWLPKSLIFFTKAEKGSVIEVELPYWLLDKIDEPRKKLDIKKIKKAQEKAKNFIG